MDGVVQAFPIETTGRRDVRAHPIGQVVMDGAHFESDGLERAEGTLDVADVRHAARRLSGAIVSEEAHLS